MKTLKLLLKASLGKAVLTLTGCWMIALGVYVLCIANELPKKFFFFVATLLTIWTIGYFFSIASRFAKGAQKPLLPMQMIPTFLSGIGTVLRLIFIFSILILIETILYVVWPPAQEYFEKIVLIYIVLIVSPYLLFITAFSEKRPWIKGFLSFIKKHMTNAFAFIFWLSLSFVVYNFVARFIFRFSTSMTAMIVISFALFVLFFWLLIFNAVLLGYFTKRTLTPTENTVKTIEDKSEKK